MCPQEGVVSSGEGCCRAGEIGTAPEDCLSLRTRGAFVLGCSLEISNSRATPENTDWHF